MDTVEISWTQVEKMVDNVCRQIQFLPLWHGLPYPVFKEWIAANPRELWYGPEYVAVAKGGFIPAAMIAYWFNTHYANLRATGQVFDPVERAHINASSGIHIIIDDIADTGRRLSQLRTVYSEDNYGEAHRFIFVTLVKRSTCPLHLCPDYFALNYPGSEWLIFPWAPNDIPNGSEEVVSELRVGPDASGGGLPGDGTLPEGDGEVRTGQLEEGNADGSDHRSPGEPPEVSESPTVGTRPGEEGPGSPDAGE
jgi:hypoxanthine phosphoribosyltransferase